MIDVHHERERSGLSKRIRRALGLAASGIVIGVPTALGVFLNNGENTEIAATEVVITPTFDGFIAAQNGLLFPDVRTEADLPLRLGVSIDVGNTTVPSLDTAGQNIGKLAQIYGSVAAQPSGEIKKTRDIIADQAKIAVGAGLLAGAVPGGLFYLVGDRRRKELLESDTAKRIVLVGIIALTGVLATSSEGSSQGSNEVHWKPIIELVPDAAAYPELASLEVRDNAASGAMKELINGAIDSYTRSVSLYDTFIADLPQHAYALHQPADDEVVAILLSDRHDNIGMDPVHRTLADLAGAIAVIDAGDDTSAGQSWEEFSLRSLAASFPESKFIRLIVSGNHDTGGNVEAYWQDKNAVLANGKVRDVSGIQVILMNDPRQSDYTSDVVDGTTSYSDASEELRQLACASEKRIGLIVVHSASMGESALDEGCVDLVVGGHKHVPQGPTRIVGKNFEVGYSVTNSTSGGAAYSFAAFGGLRRDAGDTLITFRNGRPVGVQQVAFTTYGKIMIGEYKKITFNTDSDQASTKSARNSRLANTKNE